MGTLVNLKNSLEEAIKEQQGLENTNKRLDSDIRESQVRLKELKDKISILEDEKSGLESKIKSDRSNMISEIDRKNSESERLLNFVTGEKKTVNELKIRMEDEWKSLDKKKEDFEVEKKIFYSKVKTLEEALKTIK